MMCNKSASYYTGNVFVIFVANILGGHISINMGIQTMSLCSPLNVHITIITIIILFTECKLHVCVANMGLVLYIGGDFILRLRIVLLVGMLWADVMCDMG